MQQYFVYIMTNCSRTLYVGVTSNLVPGFTSSYNITLLIHWEETSDVNSAIAREKQIKGWTRAKKVALINKHNVGWEDLSGSWFDA